MSSLKDKYRKYFLKSKRSSRRIFTRFFVIPVKTGIQKIKTATPRTGSGVQARSSSTERKGRIPDNFSDFLKRSTSKVSGKFHLKNTWKNILDLLFLNKITISRWQLNIFSVFMLSFGFVIGTWAMVTEIVPFVRALDETTYAVGDSADSELTAGSGTDVVIASIEITLDKDEEWLDLGWNYKKQITVKNLSGVDLLADSPVQVTVNTKELYDDSKLQDDCDDLRIVHFTGSGAVDEVTRSFYKASGATNCSDSGSTVVTFPLSSSVTASGSSDDYYLYYGNAGASNPGFGDDGYNIGTAEATLVCPFNGTTTCVDGETPSTETGAIRYGTGSALSFDGAAPYQSDYVQGPTLGISDEYTIEFYFKAVAQPDTYPRIYSGWGISDGNDINLGAFSNQGNCGLLSTPYGMGFIQFSNVPNLCDNQWHHLVFQYDGTHFSSYIDGVRRAHEPKTFTISSTSFRIMNNRGAQGTVDEFRISDVARYTDDFTTSYTPFENDGNTLVLYHFDENGDDPRNTGKAIDASGNGNHGTITGAKYVSGVVGIDNTSSPIKDQSYAGHEGIFIEEGTTNLITNPSFEHTTYNTNWGSNYLNYDSSADTFTAKIAKRNSAGPFASGFLTQTDYDNPFDYGATGDRITYSHGTTIAGADFSQTSDDEQGSIVFWWTPEFSSSDLNTGYSIFYQTRSSSFFGYRWDANGFEVGQGGAFYNYDVTAGQTYLVVLRWDRDNPIDGTYDSSVSVNDAHQYKNFTNIHNLEDDWGETGLREAQGIIEGLTIYRRPLFDGTYGIDVGNGDEINQIYNSGTGKDPTLVTGSWDVVFALPTNASTGELTSGTGNAWSHPHSSNLLYTNTTNTGGFMMNGTYTADGWADEGTPSAVAALANNEKVFGGGYKVTSDSANEGIYYQKPVAAGNDWVIRTLGHSDGTCNPRVILYDQTNAAEIGHLDGTTTSSRTAPNTYIFTGEAPAGMTALRVKLINTASSGTCYWHQVEVLPNLINNPSLETGAGDPWIPSGWSNGSLSIGASQLESSIVHSGQDSVKFNTSSVNQILEISPTSNIDSGKYFSAGGYTYGPGVGNGYVRMRTHNYSYLQNSQTDINISGSRQSVWSHASGVYRKTSSNVLNWQVGLVEGAGTNPVYFDDSYYFGLNDVSLTVTPASEANSAESTGLRVDGYDTLTQPVTGLSADKGVIKFKFTPRHSAGVMHKFGGVAYVARFQASNGESFGVYWSNDNSLQLFITDGDGTDYGTPWDAVGSIVAGDTYDIEIKYDTNGIKLYVDGVERVSITDSTLFTEVPSTVWWGTNNGSGVQSCDCTISNFTALTPTENTTSPYYKFGSKSAKLVNAGSAPDEYVINIDPDSTANHTLSAYVYDGTSGNVGGTVSASIAKLVFRGTVVTPASYTDMGGGWWRLQYMTATVDASRTYGVQVLAGKTVYVDGVQLENKSAQSTPSATTYADGSLGASYAWTGEAHNSTSTRTGGSLYYPNSGKFNSSAGSVSLWFKPSIDFGVSQSGKDVLFSSNGVVSTANSVEMEIDSGRNLNFSITNSAGTIFRISQGAFSAQILDKDKWYNMVMTWDGNALKAFINNVLYGEIPYTGTVDLSSTNFYIGSSTNWRPARGTKSDFRIYDKQLLDSEVGNLYNTGLANHQSDTERNDKYADTGTWESDVLDLGQAGQWGEDPNFVVNQVLNGNTVNYESRTSADGLVWSDYTALTGTEPNLSLLSDADRYLQVKATLNSTDKSTSPSVSGFNVNYVEDAAPPTTNGENIVLKRTISEEVITAPAFTNSQSAYMSWDAGEDDPDGSGLRGYCLYLGLDPLADPATDKGLLGSSPGSLANSTCAFVNPTNSIDFANTNLRGNTWLSSTNDPYYLLVKAIDNTGNVYDGPAEVLEFYFDNTKPTNPNGLFAPSGYQKQLSSFNIFWPVDGVNAAADANSGVKGYQYRIGPTGTWYGGGHTGTQDCGDLLTVNNYTLDANFDNLPVGETPFYLRTFDNACNISATALSVILKYNADAPSAPQNLTVTPSENDKNEFEFDWDPPADFSGEEANIRYCYTINTPPNASTCTFTTNTGLAKDAYASQPGENTLYVVSRDEAGNINYADTATIKFYANTSAPGSPRNLDVADISVKSTENWRLTVSWDIPTDKGAGISKYVVYRTITKNASCSDDFSQFSELGETSGTSYVDDSLIQQDYYYCVRACDSTNNCSAASSTGTNFPDGKFTEPAELISAPVVSNISTRSAKVLWITDRNSDSKISYGLASNDYFDEEIGSSEPAINHEINLTNLEPGTQYFFKSKWTDEDGNTGISDEYTFKTAPPPSVKDVNVTSVGVSSAVITFTTTGSTSSNLLYGTTTGFGFSKEIATSPIESTYTTLLEGLDDGTKYFFRIDTIDSEDYTYEGTVLDFSTLPRPSISEVRVQQVKNAAKPTVLISWESNTAITSLVEIFPEANPDAIRREVNLELVDGEHQMIIRGLLAETVYNLTVKGSDRIGNQASSTVQRITTATDTRPPVITDLTIENSVGNSDNNEPAAQLVVTWNTDEPTTSQLEYGEGTGDSYAQKSQLDSNLTLNHTVVVSGLTPGKVYHLRALSTDDANNQATSADYVTITPKAGDNIFDLVINNISKVFSFLR